MKTNQADKYNFAVEQSDAWRIECNLKDRETMWGGVVYFHVAWLLGLLAVAFSQTIPAAQNQARVS